jgi:hypothetical protein
MFHIIFINEASIETENINTVPREYTSEKDIKETKEKEKTKQSTDVIISNNTNRPNDIRSFTSLN